MKNFTLLLALTVTTTLLQFTMTSCGSDETIQDNPVSGTTPTSGGPVGSSPNAGSGSRDNSKSSADGDSDSDSKDKDSDSKSDEKK